MIKKYKSILLIGPRLDDPKKAGGMLVFVENILEDFRELDVKHGVVDTNSQIFKNYPHMFLMVILNFFKYFRKFDHIFFIANENQLIILGPIFVFFSKIFNKEISIKEVAGSFDKEYKKLDIFRRKLVDYTLRNADIIYFETKYILKNFKHFNKRTYWHPNIRRNPNYSYKPKKYQKKFVFISMIVQMKGLDELLEVSNMLDDSFSIDIYGPIFDLKYNEKYFKKFKANYKGSLAPHEVSEKLKESNILVLPSYREGYPGIFIEAFSFGVPVLTTRLDPIMEIVQNNKNGILVEPKNIDSLYQGFLSFNNDNYQKMSKNAYESFEVFDSFKQTKKILEDINNKEVFQL